MPLIELRFPVVGQALPVDHGYALYAALSVYLPRLHTNGASIAIGPISGQWAGNGLLTLCPHQSRLRVRVPQEEIGSLLCLAGKSLRVRTHIVRVGVPTVQAIVPSPSLFARLVTIKKFTEPEPFLAAARRQFAALDCAGELSLARFTGGTREGEFSRRVLRIRDKRVVGFSLQAAGLSSAASLALQEAGIGGRRKMGCGFFVPMKSEDRL